MTVDGFMTGFCLTLGFAVCVVLVLYLRELEKQGISETAKAALRSRPTTKRD